MARASYPQIEATITHLREVLGDKAYESFAHAGEAMTIAAVANYALAHINASEPANHVASVGTKAVSAVPKRTPVASLPMNVSVATAISTGTIVAANAKG